MDDGMAAVRRHPGRRSTLAIRFATDPATVQHPVPPSEIGGIVTLDTPHTGSEFGNTWQAKLVQWAKAHLPGSQLSPDRSSDAGKCLALHDNKTQSLPDGCATPPYLPADTRLDEIAGTSTVQRTLFGVHLYDIPLDSEGVVSIDSSHGYLTSGPVGTKPPRTISQLDTVTCTETSDQTLALLQAAAKGESLPVAIINAEIKALTILWKDSDTLDAINTGRLTPDLEVMLGTELFFYPCGHTSMTRNPDALKYAAAALRDDLVALNPAPTDAASLVAFIRGGQIENDGRYNYTADGEGRPLHRNPDYLSDWRELTTPSKNIACALIASHDYDLNGTTCFVRDYGWPNPHPEGCEHTGFQPNFLSAGPEGSSVGGCYGGQPFAPYGTVLDYGHTLIWQDYGCRSSKDFLACAYLPSGSGFIVNRDAYHLISGPPGRASMLPFVGNWNTHAGTLHISADGRLTETFVYGGEWHATMQLTDPRLVAGRPTVTATVTASRADPRSPTQPNVHVGQSGHITEDDGVLRSTLLPARYCDQTELRQGTCGA